MKLENALHKLRKFFKIHKRLPSYQEMCLLFGFASKRTGFELAKKLILSGILEKDTNGKLLPKNLFPPLPLLGNIIAGPPTPAEEQLHSTMSFDNFLVRSPENSYLLKVSGDSMIEAGINPGDLVVVEKGADPKEGDIIVAHIDGEFTLKYFRKLSGKICLMPANKNYSPIYPRSHLSVFGIVISVIRKYH